MLLAMTEEEGQRPAPHVLFLALSLSTAIAQGILKEFEIHDSRPDSNRPYAFLGILPNFCFPSFIFSFSSSRFSSP